MTKAFCDFDNILKNFISKAILNSQSSKVDIHIEDCPSNKHKLDLIIQSLLELESMLGNYGITDLSCKVDEYGCYISILYSCDYNEDIINKLKEIGFNRVLGLKLDRYQLIKSPETNVFSVCGVRFIKENSYV